MEEKTRSEEIHAKGFDMYSSSYNRPGEPLDFNKIKVGVKTLEDVALNLGDLAGEKRPNYYITKDQVLRAVMTQDEEQMRKISQMFYNISGIYKRMCETFAFLYRYDWYVCPEVFDETADAKKITKDFKRILSFLDNTYIRKICGEIALQVIINGCYYGYIVPASNGLVLQELPIKYCRSRYTVGGNPAIEFNMRFFDTFMDPAYRIKVLKMFPDEFAKGYSLYKQGKLKQEGDYWGGHTRMYDGWYLLDPQSTVRFNFNGSNSPLFVNAIPNILDLDAAQDLDRRKQMQKLLKIIVQKLPLDKNGDLIFDVDEARDIHNNAVDMLRHTIGTDVLTTFTDVDAINLSDRDTATTQDDLAKIERSLYNAFGTSQNLFNTSGNMALDKSILNDESTVRNLLLQFNMFFDRVTQSLTPGKKKYNFRFTMLETTQYNYKELSKMYKDQTLVGFSKVLPQIALGQSQSFILNTIYFENEVLHLSEIMIPPIMSSTMNGDNILGNKGGKEGQDKKKPAAGAKGPNPAGEKTTGRPEKPDDQKSDKTIKNKESMS